MLAYHFEREGLELTKLERKKEKRKKSLLYRFSLTFWFLAHLVMLSRVRVFDKVSTRKTGP